MILLSIYIENLLKETKYYHFSVKINHVFEIDIADIYIMRYNILRLISIFLSTIEIMTRRIWTKLLRALKY